MRHRVWHVRTLAVGVESDLFSHGFPHLGFRVLLLRADDSSRNTDDGRPGRHILHHHGIGTDARVIANRNRPQYLGTGTNHDVITQRWVAFFLAPGGPAERDPVIQRAVISNLGRFTDHDAHAVIDEKPPPDLRARMNLYAGQPAPHL